MRCGGLATVGVRVQGLRSMEKSKTFLLIQPLSNGKRNIARKHDFS